LAFHPLPQVIPPVFNLGGFGPPRSLTFASACPWQAHSASGLQHATRRPIQTRFRFGYPSLVNLATHRNSLAHSSKGTPSRLLSNMCHRSHPKGSRQRWSNDALTVCKPTVSGTIHSPPGLTSPHTVTRWLILQKARHRGRLSYTRPHHTRR